MSKWKRYYGKDSPRYMKDGKHIKAADVPAEVINRLDKQITDAIAAQSVSPVLPLEPPVVPDPPVEAAPVLPEAVEPEETPTLAKSKVCIFCGEPRTKERFINLQTVELCDEHYYSETVGRIVAKLKEISDGEDNEQIGGS